MYCVSIAYPNEDGARFDFDYYLDQHLTLVNGFLGSNRQRVEVRRGVVAADGSPAPFICLANIWITSADAFRQTLSQHGGDILGDLPNFTDVQPIIQIDEVLG